MNCELPVIFKNQGERAVAKGQVGALTVEREITEHTIAREAALAFQRLEAALAELSALENQATSAADRALAMTNEMLGGRSGRLFLSAGCTAQCLQLASTQGEFAARGLVVTDCTRACDRRFGGSTMNKGYVGVVAGALAGLAVGVGIDSWGSNAGHDEPIAKAQQEVVSSRDVKLSAELAKRGQLATEKVEKRALAPTLKLVGSVNFDSDAVADVGGRIDGRITRMLVSIGDKVEQGQAAGRDREQRARRGHGHAALARAPT